MPQSILRQAGRFALFSFNPRLRPAGGAVWSLGATGLAGIASAVSGIIIARSLGPSDRGLFASLTVVPFLVMTAASLGMDDAVSRAIGRQELSASGARRLVWTWGLAWGSAVGLLLWPIQSLLVMGGRSMIHATLIVALAPAFMIVRLQNAIALGVARYGTWNILRTLGGLAFSAVIAIMLIVAEVTISTAVLAWIISYAVMVGCSTVAIARTQDPPRVERPFTGIRPLAWFGMKVGATKALVQICQRVDQVVLALIAPLHDLGLYAVASTVALTPGGLVLGYSSYIFGRCSRMEDEQRRRAALGLARHGWVLSILIYSVWICAVPRVLVAGFGEEFSEAVGLTRWLSVGAAFYFGSSVSAAVLNSSRRESHVTGAQTVCLLLTLVLVPLFFNYFGLAGPACGVVVANAINALILSALLLKFATSESASGFEVKSSAQSDGKAGHGSTGLNKELV